MKVDDRRAQRRIVDLVHVVDLTFEELLSLVTMASDLVQHHAGNVSRQRCSGPFGEDLLANPALPTQLFKFNHITPRFCRLQPSNASGQERALRAAGCTVIRAEKRTGTTRNGRAELTTLLEFLRPGDTLIVTRIDRLARSIGDLQDIVRLLKAKSVTLKATGQPIDTGTAAGKAFLDMLGVFAEFENNLRRERQLKGIAKAKALGVYKGRKPSVPVSQIAEMASAGQGATQIARALKIGRASVYRALSASKVACA